MIDNAFKYEERLKDLLFDTWYDPDFQFYNFCHNTPFSLDKENGDKNWLSFVSVSPDRETIHGLFTFYLDRETWGITSVGAANFTKKAMPFGNDLLKLINRFFTYHRYNRIEFMMIAGNPIEKHYDRIVERMGGRIVGTKQQAVRLPDGTLADDKMYEIMRDDYMSAVHARTYTATFKPKSGYLL